MGFALHIGHLLSNEQLAILFNGIIGISYLIMAFVVLLPDAEIPTVSRTTSVLIKIFACLFFFGCGAHHVDLAWEGAYHGAPSQEHWHAIGWNLLQVIGAPGAVYLVWKVKRDLLLARIPGEQAAAQEERRLAQEDRDASQVDRDEGWVHRHPDEEDSGDER